MTILINLLCVLTICFLSSGAVLIGLAWFGLTPEAPAALTLTGGLVTLLTLVADTLIGDPSS